MSSSLSCTICSEVYKNSDEIYSTSCGHIYHFNCMQQWKSRSTSCPQCREHNPQSHKIFLTFDEATDTEKKLLELKSQLEQSVLNASELQHQLEQTERNFMAMQLEFCRAEETAKDLSEQNEYLSIQNESRETEINLLKSTKNEESTETCNESEKLGNIKLHEQIKVLEEKLKQVSLELEKEIKNSTELTVDKMKLQSLLQQFSAGSVTTQASNLLNIKQTSDETAKELEENLKTLTLVHEKEIENSTELMHKTCETTQTSNLFTNKPATEHLDAWNGFILKTKQPYKGIPNYIACVVIRGLNEAFIKQPEHLVLTLSGCMGLKLSRDDIENISILDHRNNREMKPGMVVQFKTLELMNKFLSNKNKLQNCSQTKDIKIEKYGCNPLFVYTKTALRNVGYKFIYCNNFSVFVRKSKFDHPVLIRNKQHVDELLRNLKDEENLAATSADTLNQSMDDFFLTCFPKNT